MALLELFQETYHRATYANIHTAGTKKNFDWRVTVMDRAMEAAIDDVGIGVLFGLYDWKFEMLALQQHIRHLEEKFGVGCAHDERAAHRAGGRLQFHRKVRYHFGNSACHYIGCYLFDGL